MTHGRGNWQMEWLAITLTLPRNVVCPTLLTLMRTTRLPAVDWTDAPADLNGLVRYGERRNLVSARVPSRFKRTLLRLLRTRTERRQQNCLLLKRNLQYNLATPLFTFLYWLWRYWHSVNRRHGVVFSKLPKHRYSHPDVFKNRIKGLHPSYTTYLC